MHAFLDAVAWITGMVAVSFWLSALLVRRSQAKWIEVDAESLAIDGQRCLRWTLPDATPVLKSWPDTGEDLGPVRVRVHCLPDGSRFGLGPAADHARPLRIAALVLLAAFLASHVVSLALLLADGP